jgi:hypothetical protein
LCQARDDPAQQVKSQILQDLVYSWQMRKLRTAFLSDCTCQNDVGDFLPIVRVACARFRSRERLQVLLILCWY